MTKRGTEKGDGKLVFKSERAAKIAYGKAERAWQEKKNETNGARWALRHNADNSIREDAYTDEEEAKVKALEEETERLCLQASRIYHAADKQGFFINSYHFGHNPTRDLIHANID